MGNAADCNYCNSRGKPYSFGCPKCSRYDRSEDDAKSEARSEAARLNASHRRALDERFSEKDTK